MSKMMAVVSSQQNTYHLVTVESGRYFAILGLSTLTDALRIPLSELRKLVDGPRGEEVQGLLQPPVAHETELWGAGVTYLRSRDARKEESGVPDVYQLVYDAERPELFFKATARRIVGAGMDIGIRSDSHASLPEPEVAIVVNRFQEVVGLTVCNDVTARTIEGENPLYLSQAKIYVGSASLGPAIKPIWDIDDPKELGITAKIERGAEEIWRAETSLGSLRRTFEDLISYLFRCQIFSDGVILSTGTGIVPPLDIWLEAGDVASISVDEVGTLSNRVALIRPDIHKISLGL
jgi:2-dehydro-3-deoxy-D-arabinonate dehydratase